MIPLCEPTTVGRELEYIQQAISQKRLSGDGHFTALCNQWVEKETNTRRALLTHSCTAALEMSAILSEIDNDDEIIMPSYTFTSTANAFVLRGGVPVFVDIRVDTKNIDENKIEEAITEKTKAIVAVHYAGVCAEMDIVNAIAQRYGLIVIEDAAQALLSTFNNRPAGSLGDLGCFSFHESKNFISGEGGALTISDDRLASRAEIIREKGTNRTAFFRGEVSKYEWVDMGSSFLPSEITAAFLYAQLENARRITAERLAIWSAYYEGLSALQNGGYIQLPGVPSHCEHNGHIFYFTVEDEKTRNELTSYLRNNDVFSTFHYVPLHTSPAGRRYGRSAGTLSVTDKTSSTIIRLPIFPEMKSNVSNIIDLIHRYYSQV